MNGWILDLWTVVCLFVFGFALFGDILGCKILSLKHQTYGQLLTYLPLISYYF